jgi:hypothetical protein
MLSMARFRIGNKNNRRLGLFMALSISSIRSSNLPGPFTERRMVVPVTVPFRRIRVAAELGRLGNNNNNNDGLRRLGRRRRRRERTNCKGN